MYTSINPSAFVARSTFTPKRPSRARVASLVASTLAAVTPARPALQPRWHAFADELARFERIQASERKAARVRADKAYLARYKARHAPYAPLWSLPNAVPMVALVQVRPVVLVA